MASRRGRVAHVGALTAVAAAIATINILCAAASAHASDLSADISARRVRVMERLSSDAMLILKSAPVRNYSGDVDYEYRQDSNLYYLTGMTQEDTILVLMPGNASRKEILFIKPRDPAQEHWTGHLMSREEATAESGIHTVMLTTQFEPFVTAMLSRQPSDAITAREAAVFFDALANGRARLALTLPPRGLNDPPGPDVEFARKLQERYFGFHVIDDSSIFADLRIIKTEYEQQLLKKNATISGDAQMAGMRQAKPGAFEYEVKAAIEAVQRGRGAISWAYPSIVGSGPNATILHYVGSSRQMQAGDLLLVDAGANYDYMSIDITRTYPVSGTFTEAQKDIYAIVLRAQDEGMKVAKAGNLTSAIHNKTVEVIKDGLLKLGLITDTKGDQYRMWYTHGSVHYIGIDVHDVGERNHPLEPGVAFTIEPGIYIRQSVLDNLPRTPENLALIERIQPAVKKYADVGIRVEDSFLLEPNGLTRLSQSVPRTIEEIETFMRQRTR